MSLLEVSGLSVRFSVLEAVSDVSFSLQPGERCGIIGESGSGKTLTALAVTGLLPEGARTARGSVQGRLTSDVVHRPAVLAVPR